MTAIILGFVGGVLLAWAVTPEKNRWLHFLRVMCLVMGVAFLVMAGDFLLQNQGTSLHR